jgi:hypothetical protein
MDGSLPRYRASAEDKRLRPYNLQAGVPFAAVSAYHNQCAAEEPRALGTVKKLGTD